MKSKILSMMIVLTSISTHSLAGSQWTQWVEVRGKGVQDCGRGRAEGDIRGQCEAILRPGQHIERVELSGFNQDAWRDGWMNKERNCAYAANARCLITDERPPQLVNTITFSNPRSFTCIQKRNVAGGQIKPPDWSSNDLDCWRMGNNSRKFELIRNSDGRSIVNFYSETCLSHPNAQFSCDYFRMGYVNLNCSPNALLWDANGPSINRNNGGVILWWRC